MKSTNPKLQDFLALIDIARFTEVNDMFGNQKGDDILKQVAKRLFEFCKSKS